MGVESASAQSGMEAKEQASKQLAEDMARRRDQKAGFGTSCDDSNGIGESRESWLEGRAVGNANDALDALGSANLDIRAVLGGLFSEMRLLGALVEMHRCVCVSLLW